MRKLPNYWTKERCSEVALMCDSRSEFCNLYKGAYKRAYINGWLDEICSHMIRIRKPIGYWNYENCKTAAMNFKSRFDFSHKCSGAYFISAKNKWLDEFYLNK